MTGDDAKSLAWGVGGAVALALLAFTLWQAWQWSHPSKPAATPSSNTNTLTQEQQAQLVKRGSVPAGAPTSTLTAQEQKTVIQQGSTAGKSTLTEEQRQKLIQAGSVH